MLRNDPLRVWLRKERARRDSTELVATRQRRRRQGIVRRRLAVSVLYYACAGPSHTWDAAPAGRERAIRIHRGRRAGRLFRNRRPTSGAGARRGLPRTIVYRRLQRHRDSDLRSTHRCVLQQHGPRPDLSDSARTPRLYDLGRPTPIAGDCDLPLQQRMDRLRLGRGDRTLLASRSLRHYRAGRHGYTKPHAHPRAASWPRDPGARPEYRSGAQHRGAELPREDCS